MPDQTGPGLRVIPDQARPEVVTAERPDMQELSGATGAWRLLSAFMAYVRSLTGSHRGQVRTAKVSLGVARLHDAGSVAYVSRQLANALGVSPDEVRRVEEGLLAEKDLPDAAAVAYSRSLARRRFKAAPELREPLLGYFSQDEIDGLEKSAEAISASCRMEWALPALRCRLAGRPTPGSRLTAELAGAIIHLLGLGPLVVRVSLARRRWPGSLFREYRAARVSPQPVIDLRLGHADGEPVADAPFG